jgi:hypothetical protein
LSILLEQYDPQGFERAVKPYLLIHPENSWISLNGDFLRVLYTLKLDLPPKGIPSENSVTCISLNGDSLRTLGFCHAQDVLEKFLTVIYPHAD